MGTAVFVHWPLRAANWIGEFDRATTSYPHVDTSKLARLVNVLVRRSAAGTPRSTPAPFFSHPPPPLLPTQDDMIEEYKDEPNILGIEPINEPWEYTPLEVLKDYYWKGYERVREKAPHWLYVMHDSFRLQPRAWANFMVGCPNIALDTHIYQASLFAVAVVRAPPPSHRPRRPGRSPCRRRTSSSPRAWPGSKSASSKRWASPWWSESGR